MTRAPHRPPPGCRNAFLILMLASLGAPAAAHHSFSMFDTTRSVTVQGTVQQFVWKMPHSWIALLVGSNQTTQAWGFECHAPTLIERKGWNRHSLKSGDRISVLMHPMRDGSRAGSVVYVTLPDGRVLWNADTRTSP